MFCLKAFLALGDQEFDALTFSECFEAATFDGTVVSEDILAGILLDKAKALVFVEPFNGSSSFF